MWNTSGQTRVMTILQRCALNTSIPLPFPMPQPVTQPRCEHHVPAEWPSTDETHPSHHLMPSYPNSGGRQARTVPCEATCLCQCGIIGCRAVTYCPPIQTSMKRPLLEAVTQQNNASGGQAQGLGHTSGTPPAGDGCSRTFCGLRSPCTKRFSCRYLMPAATYARWQYLLET
jgi:hypothetical protein